MRIIGNSIRVRLKTAFFLLSVCPLVLAGVILTWQSYFFHRNETFEFQKEISLNAALQIRSYLHSLEDELTLTVRISNIMNLGREEQRTVLADVLTYDNTYHGNVFDDLLLLNGEGRELARVSRLRINGRNEPVQGAKSAVFMKALKDKNIGFSTVSVDKKSAEPLITMGIPIVEPRGGAAVGVLMAEIRLKDMWNFVKDVRIGRTGDAYILDGDGKLVVHRDPSLVLAGTRFRAPGRFGIGRGLSGKTVFLGVDEIKLGDQNLYIVTETPFFEALGDTVSTVVLVGILLAFAMAGAVAFGLMVERKIVSPIESLAGTAQAISEGDLSRRADPGEGELGTLSNSFNTMTTLLIDTIDSLQESEIRRNVYHERFVTLLDSLDSLVYVADMETYKVLFLNRYGRVAFGDIAGKICWQTLQSGQTGPCSFCTNNRLLTFEGEPAGVYIWEFRNTANDRWYYIQDRAIRWIDGRLVRLEIATDITCRKVAEDQLKASLEEKEVLLKEIHHRVKNNMQIISSLLDIQSGYIRDSAAAAMFKESRDRIRTMALIHERLYKSEDLGRIDFADYVKDLADYLLHVHMADPLAITLQIDAHADPMNIKTAVPLALIVNELLSNALKHAFPSGEKGIVRVGLSSGQDGRYELVVADDGIGFPKDVDPGCMETLGMQLVNTLVSQLKGEMVINRTAGTEFRISFQQQSRGRQASTVRTRI